MPRLWLESGTGGGSHSVYYDDDNRLTVEWYDHGPHAPYESASTLIFDAEQQELLADALKLPVADRSGIRLLTALHARFVSYFRVQDFCKDNGLKFTKKVNFWP